MCDRRRRPADQAGRSTEQGKSREIVYNNMFGRALAVRGAEPDQDECHDIISH